MSARLWICVLTACAPDASRPGPPAEVVSAPTAVAAAPNGESREENASSPSPDSSPIETAGAETGGAETRATSTDPSVVRFVALGDAGTGRADQRRVAAAIAAVCAARGCDFALYLGDNFYPTGVTSPDDPQFQTAFELPYAALNFPFFVVLGNHDYGADGAGYEWWRAEHEIAYTTRSEKWTLPDHYYSFTAGPAAFFALDTNAILWGAGDEQLGWLQQELAASQAPWKIAFGHHPYISNGPHGNAGNYEGLSWLPVVSGGDFQAFAEAGLCGQVDLYLSGHDHSRQWLEPTCGTEWVVSGAGAKTTGFENRDKDPTFFASDIPGFLWVEVCAKQLTGVFYDRDGAADYTRTVTR